MLIWAEARKSTWALANWTLLLIAPLEGVPMSGERFVSDLFVSLNLLLDSFFKIFSLV